MMASRQHWGTVPVCQLLLKIFKSVFLAFMLRCCNISFVILSGRGDYLLLKILEASSSSLILKDLFMYSFVAGSVCFISSRNSFFRLVHSDLQGSLQLFFPVILSSPKACWIQMGADLVSSLFIALASFQSLFPSLLRLSVFSLQLFLAAWMSVFLYLAQEALWEILFSTVGMFSTSSLVLQTSSSKSWSSSDGMVCSSFVHPLVSLTWLIQDALMCCHFVDIPNHFVQILCTFLCTMNSNSHLVNKDFAEHWIYF